MKHNLLRMAQYSFCIGFFSLQVHFGLAQNPKHPDDTKFKVSPELRELKDPPITARSRTLRVPIGPQKINLLQIIDGYVAIDAVAEGPDGQELLRQLQQLGLKNGAFYKRVVSGFFPIDKIDDLENVRTLHMVSAAYKVEHVGAVTSQGDSALLANVARKNFMVNGEGSKVGIISDSYGVDRAGVAAGIASGDLPANTEVLLDFPTGTDEGRAMAEIVHDVAPAAKIAFHTSEGGQATFAAGIQRLAQAGSNIIVDDVIYLAEPMFQDGIIAQSVDEVVQKNVTYFSSAGNNGRQSYQAPFRNSGDSIFIEGEYYGIAHDFGNGDITQSIRIPAGGDFQISFQWADPFFSVSGGTGARTDLDVLFFYNGNYIGGSFAPNTGRDPVEVVGLSVPFLATIEIMITKYAGPDPQLIKWVNFGNAVTLEHITNSSTTYGHSNAQGAIAVGATAWYNTPQFNPSLTRPVINSFSSAGGTPVFITSTGQRTTLDESKIRRKPEVVGPDGGNNTFFDNDTPIDPDNFPNFFGTSASAPHVAAVAALMQDIRNNSLSPAVIKENLILSAIDMDDPLTADFDTGFDFRTGYGFVQATKALETTGTFNCSLSLTTKVRQGMPGNRVGAIDLTVQGGTAPYAYRWNSGAATEDLSRALPGRYTVRVTDATGCSATTTVNVGVMGNSLTLTSSHTNAPRYGTGYGSIDLSVIGGTGPYNFKWNADVATEDLPWATPGLYSVTVTDATGATAYTAVYVSTEGQPLALQTAHNNASSWGADDGSIDLTVIGGVGPYTYKWNAGSEMEDLPRVTPGLYVVTVTDATGATATLSVRVGVKGTSTVIATRKFDTELDLFPVTEAKTNLTAYPNPVANRANIALTLAQDSEYSLDVYDLKGSLVKNLKRGKTLKNNTVEAVWEPQAIAKGIYIVRLKTQHEIQNLRLVVE